MTKGHGTAHMDHRLMSKITFGKGHFSARGPLPVNFPLDPLAVVISGKYPNLKGKNICVGSQAYVFLRMKPAKQFA